MADVTWWKEFASAVQSFGTILLASLGGLWAYRKFVLRQERYPHIETSADISFIGEQAGHWIVELTVTIENKGSAQHRMKLLRFELASLLKADVIEAAQEFGGQTRFPNIVKEGTFLPERYKFFYVDPNIKAKYSYIIHVPENTAFLMLHVWFSYDDERKYRHVAEKTVMVPVKPAAQRVGLD